MVFCTLFVEKYACKYGSTAQKQMLQLFNHHHSLIFENRNCFVLFPYHRIIYLYNISKLCNISQSSIYQSGKPSPLNIGYGEARTWIIFCITPGYRWIIDEYAKNITFDYKLCSLFNTQNKCKPTLLHILFFIQSLCC